MACGGGGGSSGHVCSGAVTTPPFVTPDYDSTFTGLWYVGAGYMSSEGDSQSMADTYLEIYRGGPNKLWLPLCPRSGDKVPALVTAPSTLETVCYVCGSISVEGCDDVAVTFDGGGVFTLDSGALSVPEEEPMTGTLDGCGVHADFTMWLSATRADVGGVSSPADGTPFARMFGRLSGLSP